VLHQRLKNHLHRTIINAEKDCPSEARRPVNPLNLDYLIIIDFEATCREDCPTNWLYEIIEFPAILLNVHTLKVVGFARNVKLLVQIHLSISSPAGGDL